MSVDLSRGINPYSIKIDTTSVFPCPSLDPSFVTLAGLNSSIDSGKLSAYLSGIGCYTRYYAKFLGVNIAAFLFLALAIYIIFKDIS